MSFRCEICDKPQPIGHAPIKIVTKTRDVNYPKTSKIGKEIVEEKACCEPCAVAKQIAMDEAAAAKLEAQNKNFEEQASGDRPSEWRDKFTAAP